VSPLTRIIVFAARRQFRLVHEFYNAAAAAAAALNKTWTPGQAFA